MNIDYRGDFVPSPVEVIIHDPSVTLKEIAEKIYRVAEHPVTYEGEYLAGSPADASKHQR